MATSRFCEQCGSALSASANFCPNCGLALTGGTAPRPAGRAGGHDARSGFVRSIAWILPSAAVVAVIVFAVMSGRPDPSAAAPPMGGGFAGAASDISQLSADERVDRLFNRVMAAASEGKLDTVAFFSPMAIMSFQALEPLTEHRRYDLGLIFLVASEPTLARAQADSILMGAPKHLLGLALAMRASTASGDEAARKRFAARYLEALKTERARDLSEYKEHATDITEATAEAEGRSKISPMFVPSKGRV